MDIVKGLLSYIKETEQHRVGKNAGQNSIFLSI